MKSNKKIFIVSLYYLLISFICLSALLLLLIWVIVDINNPTLTLTAKIIVFTFVPVSFLFCLFIFGACFIQWVTIDDEKIIARNLFKKIREVKWDDLKEIKIVSIGYTPIHPKFKWLLLIDSNNGEVYLNSPFNWRGRYIKIRNTNKINSLIKKYRADICIE